MRRLFIIVGLLVSVIVSAESFNGHKYYDKFTKETKYEIDMNSLGSGLSISFGTIDNQMFYMKIIYTDDNWIFIPSGESFQMLIDEKLYTFSGDGSVGNRDVIEM